MKDNKVIQNDLKTLLKGYLKDDSLDNLLNNSNFESVRYVSLNNLHDNFFIEKCKIDESKIVNLKNNIEKNGVLTPFIVRKNKGYYEVILYRLNFLACLSLNIKEVPIIEVNLNDEETLIFLLSEIKNRKTINYLEYSICINLLKTKFNYSNQELSKMLDISTSQVVNLCVLANSNDLIKKEVSLGNLSYSKARTISRLKEEDSKIILDKIKKDNLSVREIEDLVRELKEDSSFNNKYEYLIDEDNLLINIKFNDKDEFNKFIKKNNKYFKK